MRNPSSLEAAEKFIANAKRLVEASKIEAPPVDPVQLAKIQGVRQIVLSESLEVSGQLMHDHEGLVIRLNGREPVERRNFSCCHEIAHAFEFGSLNGKSRVAAEAFSCSPSSPEEYLCDLAAAEMLMPEKFFKPLATKLCPSISSLSSLSRTFVSSISATIVRLGQLSIWPVVFIIWRFTSPPDATRKLRVFWSVRPNGYRCFVPRYAAADPASGIYAAFITAHSTCEIETLDLGSLRGKYLVESGRFGGFLVSIVHDPRLSRLLRRA